MKPQSLISPPGDTIHETMQHLGLSTTDLAPKLKLSIAQTNDLIMGQMPIYHQLAEILENALGIDKSFWMKRESDYRIEVKRK